jgi:hypothetical protein
VTLVQSGVELAGRYRLERLLGQGGMGEVWRALDLDLHRAVAVKVLSGSVHSEHALARLRREARITAQLSHPAIAVVHDIGVHEGDLFLVLELLQGRNLSVVMDERPGGLPIERVLDYGAQIADGLAAAHQAGVVHRDIKPGNVMLLDNGQVKICDFGIARLEGATAGLTRAGAAMGTVAYMPPEQLQGRTVDGRADLYALGCALFCLLTGRGPFPGTDWHAVALKHLTSPPPSVRSLRGDVPADLDAYLLTLLAKDPADRPADPAQVAKRLRTLKDRYSPRLAEARRLLAEVEHLAHSIEPSDGAVVLANGAQVFAIWDLAEAERLLGDAAQLGPPAFPRADDDDDYVMDQAARVRALALARAHPADAERLAHTITDRREQFDTLKTVAVTVARYDPAEAQRIARASSTDRHRQHEALGEVVMAIAEDDPHEAERLAGIVWYHHRDRVKAKAAMVLARQDPVDAERIARTIGAQSPARAFVKIAAALGERHPADADRLLSDVERSASAQGDAVADASLLAEAANLLASRDAAWAHRLLSKAEQAALRYSDPFHRACMLTDVAELTQWNPASAERMLNDAERFARTGSEPAWALRLIATALGQRDPDRARQLLADAEHAASTRGRVDELTKIAVVLAERDLADAERLANTIPDPMQRSWVLCSIAAALTGSSQSSDTPYHY